MKHFIYKSGVVPQAMEQPSMEGRQSWLEFSLVQVLEYLSCSFKIIVYYVFKIIVYFLKVESFHIVYWYMVQEKGDRK